MHSLRHADRTHDKNGRRRRESAVHNLTMVSNSRSTTSCSAGAKDKDGLPTRSQSRYPEVVSHSPLEPKLNGDRVATKTFSNNGSSHSTTSSALCAVLPLLPMLAHPAGRNSTGPLPEHLAARLEPLAPAPQPTQFDIVESASHPGHHHQRRPSPLLSVLPPCSNAQQHQEQDSLRRAGNSLSAVPQACNSNSVFWALGATSPSQSRSLCDVHDTPSRATEAVLAAAGYVYHPLASV